MVGAGLPHVPAVLSASKSYSERLFRYQRIDRLAREEADRALTAPAADELAEYEPAALDALYVATGGYPYFIQAYGKAVWDQAPESPIRAEDVRVASPEAESELAVGFFGSRYERATPAEREYLQGMAELAEAVPDATILSADIDIDAIAQRREALVDQELHGFRRDDHHVGGGAGADTLHHGAGRCIDRREAETGRLPELRLETLQHALEGDRHHHVEFAGHTEPFAGKHPAAHLRCAAGIM